MKTRLRAAVLSLVALVAIGVVNVSTAAPAGAAEGETCKDPVISGSITRVVGESATIFKPIYAEFAQSGFTKASCPSTFTDYRYKVSFAYDGRTVATYNSDLVPVYTYSSGGWVRTGTRIVFPTVRLSWGGYQDVTITVTSGSKSSFSSTWCRSDEQAYDSFISVESWGGYDTLTGVPRARIISCP